MMRSCSAGVVTVTEPKPMDLINAVTRSSKVMSSVLYGVKIMDLKVFGEEWVPSSDTEKPVMGAASIENNTFTSAIINVSATDNTEIKAYHVVDATNGIDVQVVAIDGMWFCVPAKLFDEIIFDQKTFNSFHCYDLDICMQIKEIGYKVCVTNEVIIEHSSYGSFDMQWYENSQKFYNKWRNILPLVAGVDLTDEEVQIRTNFVDQVMVWQKAYAQCATELKRTKESYAYRVGKCITGLAKAFRREK